MARSHAARRRNRHVCWPGRTGAAAVSAALAGVAIAATLALPALAGQAQAGVAGVAGAVRAAGVARTAGGAAKSPPLALSVTSVSPSYATPGHKLTITGRLWNGTKHALNDMSVRLWSSAVPFLTNTALQEFAAGTAGVPGSPVSAPPITVDHLRARHSVGWTIRVPVSYLRLSCFGVYPLTVRATDPTGVLTASDPVPLPFWPNKADSCPRELRPSPFTISWIWPLIDTPHQGPCPGLLDNSLAGSLARGGRLDSLLTVGANFADTAKLTWAIDPALLDNARTMSKPYRVGDSANCGDITSHRASTAAKKWLGQVAKTTAGQSVFVTPYADVDMASMAQYGDNADLSSAFGNGERLAGPLLGRDANPAPVPAGPKELSAVAWPSEGLSNRALLEYLGAMRIGTVVLTMPPPTLSYTPGAVSTVVDGVGTKLKVLLADDSLSSLLGSSAAASTKGGSIFSVSQMFLAETAMIVAELPATQRPILVAPPRRWDPTSTLATDLLSNTVSAPWLKPATIGQLAAQPPTKIDKLLGPTSKTQLPRKLLRGVSALDSRVGLLSSIMVPKDAKLRHAVLGIESSAWAGDGTSQAKDMLSRMSQYVTSQFRGLSVGGQQVIHVTLGGRVGAVTVSIHNSLDYPVRVGLQVTSSNDTVQATQKRKRELYDVPPHSSTEPKLSVNAAQTGKATLKLSLRAPSGRLLPNPPDKPLVLKISATNLGTVALVICAAALAVFVIASAAQAIRRGRPGATAPDEPAAGDSAPDEPAPGGHGPSAGEAETEAAVAWDSAPDGADQPATPVRPDNVDTDRSELSTAGPAISHQGLVGPGRTTEESR